MTLGDYLKVSVEEDKSVVAINDGKVDPANTRQSSDDDINHNGEKCESKTHVEKPESDKEGPKLEFQTNEKNEGSVEVEVEKPSGDDTVEVMEKLADSMSNINKVSKESMTMVDAVFETNNNINRINQTLDNPESISTKDVIIATENLKFRLKELKIPLNNSKALANINLEDDSTTNLSKLSICLEDDETLLNKLKEALKKAWEWIVKQVIKLKDVIVKSNLKNQAKSIASVAQKVEKDLNSSNDKESYLDKLKETIKSDVIEGNYSIQGCYVVNGGSPLYNINYQILAKYKDDNYLESVNDIIKDYLTKAGLIDAFEWDKDKYYLSNIKDKDTVTLMVKSIPEDTGSTGDLTKLTKDVKVDFSKAKIETPNVKGIVEFTKNVDKVVDTSIKAVNEAADDINKEAKSKRELLDLSGTEFENSKRLVVETTPKLYAGTNNVQGIIKGAYNSTKDASRMVKTMNFIIEDDGNGNIEVKDA